MEAASTRPQLQFSLGTLLIAMTLIACVLGVNRWLGRPYGWITAIPLVILEVNALATRWRVLFGSCLGLVALAAVGYLFLIDWKPWEPNFLKAMVTVGMFGAAAGASVHSMFVGRPKLGGVSLLLTVVIFFAVLTVPIAVD